MSHSHVVVYVTKVKYIAAIKYSKRRHSCDTTQANVTMTGSELNGTDERDLKVIIQMGNATILSINGPLIVLNFMANVFFVFCLTTRRTRQVKPPLKMLLGSLVSFTILYLIFFTLTACLLAWVKSPGLAALTFAMLHFIMRGIMTSYAWLMFYYYIMIVPSQRALFLWVKNNIKSVLYVVMFVERSMYLGDALFQVGVIVESSTYPNGTALVYHGSSIVLFSIVNVYIFVGLGILIISSFATAHYLNKHMKSLAASNGSLISPRLHSQIRVTVTGFLQGVLCFIYTVWNLVDVMSYYLSPYFNFDSSVTFTVINLYISGTTVNLWVGQSLFRERAVHVWKAVKKRLGTGKSSKNLRPVDTDMSL